LNIFYVRLNKITFNTAEVLLRNLSSK